MGIFPPFLRLALFYVMNNYINNIADDYDYRYNNWKKEWIQVIWSYEHLIANYHWRGRRDTSRISKNIFEKILIIVIIFSGKKILLFINGNIFKTNSIGERGHRQEIQLLNTII